MTNALLAPRRAQQRGLTLIELLVAMTIGLVVTLAVTSAVIFGETTKRTTTSTNDMNQSGSYAASVVDRAVRSAGSGFAQSWDLGVFGCKPQAKYKNTAILPRTTAFPAPFEKFLGGSSGAANLRIFPVLIGKGQSSDGKSDVVMIMSGNAAAGDVPRPIISGGSSAEILRLDNTVQVKKKDIALISQVGTTDCLIEQVASTFADSPGNELVTMAGDYYTAGTGTTLASLAATGGAYYTALGNGEAQNVQFQLFGVDTNQRLLSYDLLRSNGEDKPQALADNVVELHALYGIADKATGKFTSWVAPDATDYTATAMTAKPETAKLVTAIRVGLVLRSATLEKDDVSLQIPGMFADAGTGNAIAAVNLAVGSDARRYRYRVVELTIPLRNVLLLPSS